MYSLEAVKMKTTKKFKTETKRLLDMMINSIYTHKEIFLRELISNASDAIDKRHYMSLTDTSIPQADYQILVEADEEKKTITITDNGVGMTLEELENNLGTIAKSGSKEFMEAVEKENTPEVEIIGQFGVGFYSAFMVANKVTVLTKSIKDNTSHLFTSEGVESYTIEDGNKEDYGTVITLYLKDDTEDDKYSDYLEEYKLKELIKKYSDYVRYPIKTWVTKLDPATDEEKKDPNFKPKTHKELETVNSMLPIWKKNKSEVTDEELNNFYKSKFMDWQDPITSIHVNVEGMLTYNALLFIPKKPFYEMYNDKDDKGLQLYTKGVFILEKCKELIPDYLRFVKGLVDSADLPLNISRETLQEDRAIKKIAANVEKKILAELSRMVKNDREKYEEFYKDWGRHLKFGLYENYGERKDSLKDLILLRSFNEDKLITFSEYVEKMPESQKEIYYAIGNDKASVEKLPQMDLVKSKGYDVFILSEDIDEFMITVLKSYNEKPFKSINKDELDLIDEEEKKKLDELKEEKKEFLSEVKESIPSVKEVIISKKLVDAPCCVSSTGELSFEMERDLKQQNQEVKAERVFELNPNHPMFAKLEALYKADKDEASRMTKLLYTEALLQEGILPDDPKAFAEDLNALLMK